MYITPNQTPTFRALIVDSNSVRFNKSTDLATAAELAAEGISSVPISYILYKKIAGNYVAQGTETELTDSVLLTDASLSYNFEYTPPGRASFLFTSPGDYALEIKIYPKLAKGPAVLWRYSVTVRDVETTSST